MVAFADLLRGSIRSVDVLARYGGDEFVILMPITSVENAASALARVKRNVERWQAAVAGERLGVSIGVSTWELNSEPLEEADRRMFEAKRARSLVVETLSRA